MVPRTTWSNLSWTAFISRMASCLWASAMRSSSSISRMYRSWSWALLSRPGSVDIIISICCVFITKSCASSTWPALKSSSGMGSTGCRRFASVNHVLKRGSGCSFVHSLSRASCSGLTSWTLSPGPSISRLWCLWRKWMLATNCRASWREVSLAPQRARSRKVLASSTAS